MSTSYVFFLNHTLPRVSFFTLDQTFQTASKGIQQVKPEGGTNYIEINKIALPENHPSIATYLGYQVNS